MGLLKIEVNIPKFEMPEEVKMTEEERSLQDRMNDRNRMLKSAGEGDDETGDWNKSIEESYNEWDAYSNEEFD